MKGTELLVRKRAVRAWMERDVITVTVSRLNPVRNNAGGTTAGTPTTISGIRGRLTRASVPRFRSGELETTRGLDEKDLDRFVCMPDTDLTKVMMAGDTFTANGINYQCTKVIPYAYKRSAVIEKR